MTDKRTVLVADDEEVVLEILTTLLIREGYTVQTASTGEEGLEIARGELLDAAPALPDCALVLANPGVSVATPNVFRARSGAYSGPARVTEAPKDVGALAELLAARRNDLEDPAKALVPVIDDVLHALSGLPGCRFARMSGSGATCFALFEDEGEASVAAEILRAQHSDWWIAPSRLIQPA